jgi:hypothetical protein
VPEAVEEAIPEEAIRSPAQARLGSHEPPPLDEIEPLEEVEEVPMARRREDRDSSERFEPWPYQPEGGVSGYGVPVLLLCMVLGGVLFGWLAALISQWMYLVIVFPCAIGLGVFGAGYLGVRIGKVRSPVVGALTGLLGGFVAVLTLHYGIYLRAVSEAGLDPSFRFSVPDFVRFVDARARDGVRLTSSRGGYQKDSGINLGHVGSYIYWFVEFLFVAGIGLCGILLAASQPFCGRCKSWKQKRPLGTLDGPGKQVVNVLKDGDLEQLAEFTPAPKGGTLVLTASVCRNCKKADFDVKLEQITPGAKKGQEKRNELAHLTFPHAALAAFEDVFGSVAK